MLGKLLALAIIAAIAYFALTQGVPWIKKEMGAGPKSGDDASESAFCIDQATAAAAAISDELLPAARPPVDSAVWGTVLVRVTGDLAAAERACACPTAACGQAFMAIQELRSVYDQLNDVVRGSPMGIGNPARSQERAYQLLDEARDLARAE